MIGVCIPAHDEENLIAACLESVFAAARHPDLLGETVVVVLVLDSCQDATASIAARWPVLSLATTARNVGTARGIGADCLLRQGARWLAFTDADSWVSPRWLVDQLSLKTEVVCGTVEVGSWSAHGAHAQRARPFRSHLHRPGRAPACAWRQPWRFSLAVPAGRRLQRPVLRRGPGPG